MKHQKYEATLVLHL